IPEALLLRDIVFIFQGIDGQYIKYDKSSSYIIDSKAFCSALQRELTEYYRFIAVLEAQVAKVADGQQVESHGPSLKRLFVWTQESLLKLRMMSVLVECCKQVRGGALVSTIYNYTNHGDPFIQQFINNTLEEVSRPFFEMLQRWIYGGELEDPFEEFFVACDPNVEEEDLWQSKYTIRPDMQPTFISSLLAKKVFTNAGADKGKRLSKPANTLYRHNLTGTLEAAIRASNAQYDDPDILRRLDVRLLESSFGEAGWDVFSLDYHVDSPINTIFTPHAMQQYLQLFNFLWRLKRVEHDMSSAWRRNMASARNLSQIE
ncbi:5679_t:CDS:2, partial [Racocetra fulgida]